MTAPAIETIDFAAANGRVLPENVPAARDYPPFNRSMRDGFAVRGDEVPGRLRLIGEVRAGETFHHEVNPGETVEIMTGAPVPPGADAVVMVEHCERHDDGTISTDRRSAPGANIAPRGSEAQASAIVLSRGTRIDYAADS